MESQLYNPVWKYGDITPEEAEGLKSHLRSNETVLERAEALLDRCYAHFIRSRHAAQGCRKAASHPDFATFAAHYFEVFTLDPAYPEFSGEVSRILQAHYPPPTGKLMIGPGRSYWATGADLRYASPRMLALLKKRATHKSQAVGSSRVSIAQRLKTKRLSYTTLNEKKR